MQRRSRSLFLRYASLYPRLVLLRIAKSVTRFERSLRNYLRQTPPRRRFSRILGIVLFGCMSVVLLGDYGCESCREPLEMIFSPGFVDIILETGSNLLATYGLAGLDRSGSARPRVIGSDGSQTGVASFLGNSTAITQPYGTYFTMLRQADCSLTLLTATSSLNGTANSGSIVSNYQNTLHQLAGLKTTANVFPKGCVEKTTGVPSRAGVFVGFTKQNVAVMATAQGNGDNNAVFVLTTSNFSTGTFAPLPGLTAASAVAASDLNEDGAGDLVVVNDYNATSAYVSVVLGNPDGSFQSAVNYPTAGNMSVAAVVDDINGDGKRDLIVASDDQHVSVLLGNGDGTFQAAQSFSAAVASNSISSLITADLRGTGRKDIICSNGMVLLNNGDGTFSTVPGLAFPTTMSSSSETPLGMASGDLNNDGKIDLVVGNGDTIAIWLGNGDGTFRQGTSYASIGNSGYVTVSDLDGDGNLDIYSGLANGGLYSGDDSNNASAYALMGNGDGTFQGAPTITAQYTGNNLGDINGDGIPDLITNILNQYNEPTLIFSVELGTGKGTFTPVSTITLPATITVTSSQFLNPVTLSSANATIVSYAVGDLNGDGKADLAFLADYNGVNVYFVSLSNGDGTFATPVGYGTPQIAPSNGYDITTTVGNLEIGDFNHDGKADLIFNFNDIAGPFGNGLYLQGLAVLPGTGNGTTYNAPIFTYTYNSTTTPTANNNAPTVDLVADLNGDGIPDLIVTSSSFAIVNSFGVITSTIQTYTGKGDGTFNSPNTVLSTNKLGPVVLADFNHDGKLDIAALGEIALTSNNTAQGQLFTALGNGDGTFATATAVNIGGGDVVPGSGFAAADFDGDGNVDLALLDGADFSGIYYGKGDGTFVSVPFNGNPIPKDLINIGAGAPAVAVDLNNDGKPDILAGNTILINTYGVTSTAPTLFGTTTGLTASASSIPVGGSITFTAAITPATGSTGTPTGTVTFLDNTTILGTGNLVSGTAIYATTALIAGSHSITAVYSGDNAFSTSTSSTVNVTITAAPKVPIVTVTPATSTITTAQALTVTVAVSGGTGNPTPTGSVTLKSGSYTGVAATLSNGSATIIIPAGSLTAGTDTVSAAYTGDSNYTGATGTVSVTVTAAPVPSFAVSGTAVSIAPGATTGNTSTITVTPSGGFTGNVTLTASVTSSPAGAVDSPTLSFGATSPVSITGATAGTGALTVSSTAATTGVLAYPPRPGSRWYAAGGAALAGLLLFGIPARRRRWRTILGLLVFLAGGMVACGGKSNNGGGGTTSNPGTSAGNYTVTVIATSGTLTAQTTVAVTVQ